MTTDDGEHALMKRHVGDDDDVQEDGSDNEHVSKRPRLQFADIGVKRAPRKDGEFEPGAIMRVKMINFVTYSHVEFNLGEALNMVIGPNGTGKSTFVCAICIGLNGSPNILGRAKELKEFVKNGEKRATVEIELKGFPTKPNAIIRREFDLDNKSVWTINGSSKIPQKQVDEVVRRYNIQVDNLCQFLPQDRVASFAQSTPSELLRSTERAIGEPQLLQQHEKLIVLASNLKEMELNGSGDVAELEKLQKEHERESEVIRSLEDLDAQIMRKEALGHALPMARLKEEMQIRREIHNEFEAAKKQRDEMKAELGSRFGNLKTIANRTKEAALVDDNKRQAKVNKVELLLAEKKSSLNAISEKTGALRKKLDQIDDEKDSYKSGVDRAKRRFESEEKKYESVLEKKLTAEEQSALKEKAREAKAAYDEATSNVENVRLELRPKNEQMSELKSEAEKIKGRLEKIKDVKNQKFRELKNSNSRHAAQDIDSMCKAVQILRGMDHSRFKGTVHEPPVLSVTLKNNNATVQKLCSNLLARRALLTFTVENSHDFDIISKEIVDRANVSIVNIAGHKPLAQYVPPFSRAQLEELHFSNWLIDFLDGPESVLRMLCDEAFIHTIPVAMRQLPADIDDKLSKFVTPSGQPKIQQFADQHQRRTLRRSQYGTKQVFSSSSNMRDFVADYIKIMAGGSASADKDRLDSDLAKVNVDLERIKSEMIPLITQRENLTQQVASLKEARDEAKHEYQSGLNTASKIEYAKKSMTKAKQEYDSLVEKTPDFEAQHAALTQKIADQAGLVDDLVRGIPDIVAKLVQLQMDIQASKLLKAECDNEMLVYERLSVHGVQQIEELIQQLKARGKEAVGRCTKYEARVNALTEDQRAAGQAEIDEIGQDSSLLRSKLDSVSAAIDRIQDDFPDAAKTRREYSQRAEKIAKLEERVGDHRGQLESIQNEINSIREEWEPKLEQLLSYVSQQFKSAFADIDCEGEVLLDKHPSSFKDWAVKIMVSFRQGAPMQPLTGQRQSGGERAVSTILYLMSLQELVRSPFRVVDEINQGMDPVNERMVHNRMVDTACGQATSQYFLITPKLLTDLKYDKRMKISCIFSGHHVDSLGGKKLTAKSVLKVVESED